MKFKPLQILVALLACLAFGAAAWAQSAAPAASAQKYVNGVYNLDYVDPELGSVSVQVTIKDGRIAEVSFPKGKGDVTMEDDALAAWLKSFIAAPDILKVDVVSGATQSCDLIRYAVQNALKSAVVK